MLPLGPPPSDCTLLLGLGLPIVERTKILGMWFSSHRSMNDHYEWNYKETLAKMRTICHSWHNRNLSLKGKIVVFNSLVVSMLHYVAAHSELPNRVLYELKKMVVHFLWKGGPPKVAYSTLIQPIEDGGLKLADFASRIYASRLLWVRRLILSDETFSRDFVNFLSGNLGLASLILGKPKTLPPGQESSWFYSETFELWLCLHGFSPTSESEVRWEMLWNNKRISMEGKPLTWTSWSRLGITRIDNIIHPTEGRFLSHLELNDKFGSNSSFLEALQLRQSVPGAWRSIITPHGRPPDEAGLYLSVLPDSVLDLFSASPPFPISGADLCPS